jgi:hypothetical protein
MTKKLKLLLVALVLLLPLPILALEVHGNDNIVLGTDKIIDSNYYAAGQNVEIYGTVNGDLFLAGDTIIIDSTNINGDIFVAGSDISISGKINGSVRAAGEKININGNIVGNFMFFGQQVTVNDQTIINGHMTTWGQIVNMHGHIMGNLEGGVESLLVSGQVGRNVDMHISSGQDKSGLQIEDTAVINGELKYKAWQEGDIAEGATITGGTSFDQILKVNKTKAEGLGLAKSLLIQFFMMLVVGMVLIYLWPKLLPRTFDLAHQNLLVTFFKGLGLLVLTPVAVIILLFTVIGAPLGLMLLGLWLMMLYLAKVIGAWLLIRFLQIKFFSKKKISDITLLALGILFFIILSKIPIVGWIIIMIVSVTAWGTVVGFIFKNKQK